MRFISDAGSGWVLFSRSAGYWHFGGWEPEGNTIVSYPNTLSFKNFVYVFRVEKCCVVEIIISDSEISVGSLLILHCGLTLQSCIDCVYS